MSSCYIFRHCGTASSNNFCFVIGVVQIINKFVWKSGILSMEWRVFYKKLMRKIVFILLFIENYEFKNYSSKFDRNLMAERVSMVRPLVENSKIWCDILNPVKSSKFSFFFSEFHWIGKQIMQNNRTRVQSFLFSFVFPYSFHPLKKKLRNNKKTLFWFLFKVSNVSKQDITRKNTWFIIWC